MADEPTIPLLFLGDAGVGKSSFISRLTHPTTTTPLPPLSDALQPYVFDLTTRHGPFRLELSDTSFPDGYRTLRPDVIILCYDISSRESLYSVQARWKHEVETHFNYDERMPVMLLGLKRDCRSEEDPECVMPQEAVRVAQEMRCDRYAECSARTGELCKLAFEDVVAMAVATRGEGGGKTQGWACGVM